MVLISSSTTSDLGRVMPCRVAVLLHARRLSIAGHVTIMEEGWNVFKLSSCKPREKKYSKKPKCRWKENVRIYLEGINQKLIDSVEDRDNWKTLVNSALNVRFS